MRLEESQLKEVNMQSIPWCKEWISEVYCSAKHEADAFELYHVIAYKQSLKFNLPNVSMEVNLENFLPRKLPSIR